MKKAVVIGVNGQDGSYLAEILLDHDYSVLGIGLQECSRYIKDDLNFQYVSLDLKNSEDLIRILKEYQPNEIYHLAAVHGSAGFQYESIWDNALDVNLKSFHSVLEYARNDNPTTRIAYASSSKIFGNDLAGNISLSHQRNSDCLYSITKNAASELSYYYYTHHNIFVSIAIFFNHDSIRRSNEYFIPKIVGILVNAINNDNYIDEIETLDFYCNWGCAYEYMTMFKKILSLSDRQEIIIASKKTWYGRDFVKELFKRHDLDYKSHIKERNEIKSSKPYVVEIKDTTRLLGITPTKSIFSVCDDILEECL